MMLLAGEDCLTTSRGGAFSQLLAAGRRGNHPHSPRKNTYSCQESAQIARSPRQVSYTAEVSPNFGHFPKSKIFFLAICKADTTSANAYL